MADLSFYTNPDLEDGFGATAGRRRPHGGLDFPHGYGTPIPALFSGTIAAKGDSAELGFYTQVRLGNGKVATYCHSEQPSPFAIGQQISQGEIINTVGARGYATGPHLHIAIGDTLAVGYAYCEDPWPWVQRALNGEDIPDGGTPAPEPVPSEDSWELAPGGEPNAPHWPRGPRMARVQRALSGMGRYDGIIDGIGGQLTAEGIQITLNVSGKNGGIHVPDGSRPTPIDGKLGENNAWGVQEYAKDFGDYNGLQDGDPREGSWDGFALGLERK